ncbi:hypothetical protein ACI2KR_09185 [Pseudomonas luteola]
MASLIFRFLFILILMILIVGLIWQSIIGNDADPADIILNRSAAHHFLVPQLNYCVHTSSMDREITCKAAAVKLAEVKGFTTDQIQKAFNDYEELKAK